MPTSQAVGSRARLSVTLWLTCRSMTVGSLGRSYPLGGRPRFFGGAGTGAADATAGATSTVAPSNSPQGAAGATAALGAGCSRAAIAVEFRAMCPMIWSPSWAGDRCQNCDRRDLQVLFILGIGMNRCQPFHFTRLWPARYPLPSFFYSPLRDEKSLHEVILQLAPCIFCPEESRSCDSRSPLTHAHRLFNFLDFSSRSVEITRHGAGSPITTGVRR
jgi:hypothetical protein